MFVGWLLKGKKKKGKGKFFKILLVLLFLGALLYGMIWGFLAVKVLGQ